MRIPRSSQFTQTNRSDIFGDLSGSFNLDLNTNVGKTRVNKMLTTTSGVDGVPVAIKSTGTLIYAVAGTKVYISAGLKANTSFTPDIAAGSPVDCDEGSDLEIFLSGIAVAANSKLYYNNGSWTNNSLGFSGPYSMCVYASTLYIAGAGGTIKKTTDGTTIAAALSAIAPDQEIMWIRAGANRIWIGTVSIRNGKGQVLEWDGAAAQVTRSYRLETQGTLACVIKDDVPWIFDTNGKLLVFSGGTFVEQARFPLLDKILKGAFTTVTLGDKPLHKNGVTISNGRINALLRNTLVDSTSSIPEICPSGIWEYSETIGLYHKYSLSYTPVGSNTITDYGQNRLSVPGALSEMKIGDTAATATGNLIAGATVFTDSSATTSSFFTNDTFEAVTGSTGEKATQAFGYFVTTKIPAEGVQDTWQKLFAFHEKFLTATDKIIVKYRYQEVKPTEASITWLTTTAFTTSTDVSAYVVGDEVEVTQGTGGGLCAHITDIQAGSGSSYIVTLEETFTGATGTAKARFQKWKKAGVIQDDRTFGEVPLGDISDWIQLKVAFLSTGKNELRNIELVNTTFKDYN